MYSLIASVIVSLTNMSNISVINWSSCLEFLGDYEIKSVEMKSGSGLSGEAIIRVLIDNEEYELRVEIKEGKKEGVGLVARENGTLFMQVMFVNDECEGEVIKKNEYGNIVLRGRVSKGKEVGMWIEYDNGGNEIWRGFYRNGKRYLRLKEQRGMKGFYSEMSVNGELLSVSEYNEDGLLKNGRCFEYEGGKIKRECVYENGMKKRVIREFTDDGLMRLFDDNEEKVYEGVWFGDMVNGFGIHPEMEKMKGFFKELNEKRELLSVSEYDECGLLKNGKCFEYEGGRLARECEYKNGVMMRVLRDWKGGLMIEYDDNGMRVYEGGFEGDMMRGFVRKGKGTEFGIDGENALYVGGWKNGKREGYGSEFKGLNPVYIGGWKNGMRDGNGKELNENGEVMRSGRWIEGEYDVIKRFEEGYGNDLGVFDTNCLKEIERLEIGDGCFKKVNRFVIDGLNDLKSIIIGNNSFELSEEIREGSKCLIMNCDQLREIHIGFQSFYWYESFELKNLPSLISIQLDDGAFHRCHSIVFESMTD